MTKILIAIGVLAVLAPVSLDIGPTGTSGAVVRISEACGQATSCKAEDDYICSTYHQDHTDYICYTGCAPKPEG